MQIDRPLDFINSKKGKEITVILTDDKEITGKLITFDLNINLLMELRKKSRFIKGNMVKAIY